MAVADDAGTVLAHYHHMLVAVIAFRDVDLPSTDLGPGPLSPNSHIPELSSVQNGREMTNRQEVPRALGATMGDRQAEGAGLRVLPGLGRGRPPGS